MIDITMKCLVLHISEQIYSFYKSWINYLQYVSYTLRQQLFVVGSILLFCAFFMSNVRVQDSKYVLNFATLIKKNILLLCLLSRLCVGIFVSLVQRNSV